MAAQTGIGSFAPATSGTAVINNILTQEANRISSDIYAQTLHTSPWIDLIKKSAFPTDMGYQLNTIVYDRSLPLRDDGTAGLDDPTTIGVTWTGLGTAEAAAGSQRTGFLPTPATKDGIGPQTGKSVIDFNRQLKSYSLSRSVLESPRINIEDLRFAAHRQEQLRAIMDILKESTRYSWEERYRDEYDRLCANILICKATGSASAAKSESLNTFSVYKSDGTTIQTRGINGSPVADSTANISNKVLDGLYFKLVRAGAGTKAYGRENGRPVFGLVLSSEASYALQTEAGFRDDVRYNASKVSDLIAPLGIEKAFRGFYHLVDDLAPRFSYSATTGSGSTTEYTRILPYTFSSTTSVIIPNTSYDTASYEAAYVLHEEVMEALIPEPVSGVSGLQFNPVNYRGDFRWTNIPNESTNPDGTVGFFRGILASASKPIKTNFGYAIIFKRDSTTPAA